MLKLVLAIVFAFIFSQGVPAKVADLATCGADDDTVVCEAGNPDMSPPKRD